MRSWFTILLATTVTLTGCLSKTVIPPAAAPANQLPQEVSFRVSGSLAPASVKFRLGRALEVGPAENGQVHPALLSESELATLQRAWDGWKRTAFGTAESCTAWAAESTWREAAMRISLLQNEQEVLTVRSDAGQLCGTGSAAELRIFASVLFELVASHYPKSFPDECLARQDEFRAVTENLVSCTEDSQCANVDPQFEAIGAGQIQYVALKGCSAVPAFPSANRESLEGAKRLLIRLKDRVQQVCQPQGQPATCSAADVIGFQNDRHPARCVEGVCSSGLSVE